ncbi:MAG: type I-B CRISPR-associated protein Cas5b [Fervidobacterium sp.]
MKCLKIKAYQETACYKKPYAFKVAETYPLPPYSTIKGLIHYILNAKKFYDMAISVQGSYESLIENYQTFRFFKIENNEITKMPLNVHLLYNVNLLIHIYTHDDLMHQIYERLISFSEVLSLGRKEDLLKISKIKFVEFSEFNTSEKSYDLKYSAYIPSIYELSSVDSGTIKYRLNYRYEISNTGIRNWVEKIDVYYVQSNVTLYEETIYKDEEDDAIFFHKKVEEVKNSGYDLR